MVAHSQKREKKSVTAWRQARFNSYIHAFKDPAASETSTTAFWKAGAQKRDRTILHRAFLMLHRHRRPEVSVYDLFAARKGRKPTLTHQKFHSYTLRTNAGQRPMRGCPNLMTEPEEV